MLSGDVGCSIQSGSNLSRRADHVDGLGDAPGAVGVQAQAAVADGGAHRRGVAQVGLLPTAHLQVDHGVAGGGQRHGVFFQLLRGVALHEAEVVHLVAHGAAQQVVHGAARGLAGQVPQRHVQAGQRQVGRPRRVVEAAQVAGPGEVPLDLTGRLPNDQRQHTAQRRHGGVGGHGRRGFAHAHQPLIRGHFHEHHGGAVVDAPRPVIGLLEREPQGRELDMGDLHGPPR